MKKKISIKKVKESDNPQASMGKIYSMLGIGVVILLIFGKVIVATAVLCLVAAGAGKVVKHIDQRRVES